MFETELKFQVPPESVAAVRAAMTKAAPRRQHLRATYFDTAEGDLAKAGIALRLRQEGARRVQTLKARGAHAAERYEHNAALPARGAEAQPLPARHAGSPAAEAWREALGQAVEDFDAGRLQPVMETDVWRRALMLRGEGWAIELAFDEGEIRAGGGVATVCELEYERVEGTRADLLRAAGEGVAQHGLWLDTVSKAERGDLLARGRAFAPATRFVAPRELAQRDGAALWRDALQRCTAMLLPNASALAGGSTDPEHVHQLRVAIRRLRCAVSELGPLVGLKGLAEDEGPAWLPPLVDAFRALGAGRDEVALLAAVAPQLQAAGAPCTDWRAADSPPPAAPAAALRAPAVQQALLALLAASQAGGDANGVSADAATRHLRGRLAKLQAQAGHAGQRFEALPEEEQHRTRKRVKRLRYLAEFVGPVLGKRSAQKRFQKPLANAQDRLGEYQDLIVALPLYRAACAREPKAWFAVGWLVAERVKAAEACHLALRELAREKPFW